MALALPPLVLNSLPKSGTHLLTRVIEGLPRYAHNGAIITTATAQDREDPSSNVLVGVSTPRGMRPSDFMDLMGRGEPARYSFGHIPYTQATHAILEGTPMKMIALLRDPRAVVCSFTHFILSRPNHWLHKHFAALPTLEAQLALAIKGMEPGPENNFTGLLPIGVCFESIAQWRAWPGAALVFFEDLIGPRGGGTSNAQLETVTRILEHVGYDLDKQQTQALCEGLFAPQDAFFRKGQIDDWKNYFTPGVEQSFEEHAGDALESYHTLIRSRAIRLR